MTGDPKSVDGLCDVQESINLLHCRGVVTYGKAQVGKRSKKVTKAVTFMIAGQLFESSMS